VAIKTKKQAEDIINSVLNNQDNDKPIIIDEPEKFEARVTRLAPNPRFVYGSLEGIQIEIFMPRYRENSVGRKITVVRAEEIGENKFKVAQ
jgi:hypothetical protein